jgi:hypothetical protein
MRKIAITLVLLVAACGHDNAGTPTPAPTVPVVAPSAAPTSAPVLSNTCARLGPGVATDNCGTEAPVFSDEVFGAIDRLQATRPDIFVGDTVVKVGPYYIGLIGILDKEGLCSAFNGEELEVKRDQTFSESYHVLTSKGQVHRKYMGSCAPAAFPLPGGNRGPAPAPGCNLPRSVMVACGTEPTNHYYADVEAAISQVLKEHPELFDHGHYPAGHPEWPAVNSFPKYISAMEAAMVQRGYCATWNGESMEVKKTNDFSEAYKIQYQDQYIRRGEQIYMGTCYPASF